ncbi:S1 RNA binding [Gracilaria domingensis]|nr:S1 RNA binding [Gracilaria domingensis]
MFGLSQAFCCPAPLFESRQRLPNRTSYICCSRTALAKPNASPARRKPSRKKPITGARCISDVSVGDEFIGVVGFAGPAESSWVDIGVCTKGGRQIMARLRFARGKQGVKRGERAGSIVPVYVHRVQPDSGRIEVRRGTRPVAKNYVPEHPLMIQDVHVGDKFDGTVMSVGRYGAVVNANIYRVGRRGRIVCHTGLLRRENFKTDWASDADLVSPAKVSKTLRAGDDIQVWVRKVHAENALLLFDASVVTQEDMENEREAYLRNLRKRRKRLQISTLAKGDRRVGIVTNIAKYGLFVNVGVKKNGLIHFSRMPEKQKRDWQDFEAGLEVYVEVTDIEDDQIALTLIGTRDQMLREALEKVNSATARVEEVRRAQEIIEYLKHGKPEADERKYAQEREIVPQTSREDGMTDVESSGDDEDSQEVEKFSDEYFEEKYGL